MTNQKMFLYKLIKTFSSFFDTYQIYENVTEKKKKIGLATIYRFLNKLEKDGEIHSFVCGNKKVYSSNKTNHVHYKCERCGKVKHITIKNLDFLSESMDDVCHFQIELAGICLECKNIAKANNY